MKPEDVARVQLRRIGVPQRRHYLRSSGRPLTISAVSHQYCDASGAEAGIRVEVRDYTGMRQIYMGMALAAAVSLSATEAMALSKKVEDACAGDYQTFCSQYLPRSTKLRRCFESNRKGLSKWCVRALVDAGEVPAKYLKK